MNKEIKKKKHEWELNGIVKCKECGAKMTLKVEYKRNNPDAIRLYRGEYMAQYSWAIFNN